MTAFNRFLFGKRRKDVSEEAMSELNLKGEQDISEERLKGRVFQWGQQ